MIALAGLCASSCFLKKVTFVPDYHSPVDGNDGIEHAKAYVYGRFHLTAPTIAARLSLEMLDNTSPPERVHIPLKKKAEYVFAVAVEPGVYCIPYLLLSRHALTGVLIKGEYSRIRSNDELFSSWFELRAGDLVYIGDYYGEVREEYSRSVGMLKEVRYEFVETTKELKSLYSQFRTMRPRGAWPPYLVGEWLTKRSGVTAPPPAPTPPAPVHPISNPASSSPAQPAAYPPDQDSQPPPPPPAAPGLTPPPPPAGNS